MVQNSFENDIAKNKGYQYTTNAPCSSVLANKRITEITLGLIPPNTRSIIDVGCGDGTYTNEIKRKFPSTSILGTDTVKTAIGIAQINYPNITFSVSDILSDNSNKIFFDTAILRGVLHHTDDPSKAIDNLRHSAANLIILEPNGNNPILKIIEKISHYHIEHGEKSFHPSNLIQWCEKSGWKIESVEYFGFVPFFCPQWMAKALYCFQPLLEKIPFVKNFFSASVAIKCRN